MSSLESTFIAPHPHCDPAICCPNDRALSRLLFRFSEIPTRVSPKVPKAFCSGGARRFCLMRLLNILSSFHPAKIISVEVSVSMNRLFMIGNTHFDPSWL